MFHTGLLIPMKEHHDAESWSRRTFTHHCRIILFVRPEDLPRFFRNLGQLYVELQRHVRRFKSYTRYTVDEIAQIDSPKVGGLKQSRPRAKPAEKGAASKPERPEPSSSVADTVADVVAARDAAVDAVRKDETSSAPPDAVVVNVDRVTLPPVPWGVSVHVDPPRTTVHPWVVNALDSGGPLRLSSKWREGERVPSLADVVAALLD